MIEEFRAWLRRRGAKSDTQYSDAIHIERDYGNLEVHFARDSFQAINNELSYDANDRRDRRGNPSRMQFRISAADGTDDYYKKLAKNLSNYRSVLKAYGAFLIDAGGDVVPAHVSAPEETGTASADSAPEGVRRSMVALAIERDPTLSKAAKALSRKQNRGLVCCAACNLSDMDEGLFDAHHIRPLSLGARETTLDDLVVLCPTCHRWAHIKAESREVPLSMEVVRSARKLTQSGVYVADRNSSSRRP